MYLNREVSDNQTQEKSTHKDKPKVPKRYASMIKKLQKHKKSVHHISPQDSMTARQPLRQSLSRERISALKRSNSSTKNNMFRVGGCRNKQSSLYEKKIILSASDSVRVPNKSYNKAYTKIYNSQQQPLKVKFKPKTHREK